MGLKPSDFFIGVIDFFSVFLPGAMVTYFLEGLLYVRLFGEGRVFPEPTTGTQKWMVFFLITYIVGNIIFLTGALLLDKLVYDRLLRNVFFKKNFDLAYQAATVIREQYISSATWVSRLVDAEKLKGEDLEKLLSQGDRGIINTFKWGQYYLGFKHPEALVDIKKLVADSKFFRSLVIASIIIGSVQLGRAEFIGAACFFVLSLLSLFRYGDLRYKSTEATYELLLTLEHLTKPAQEEDREIKDNRSRFLASPEIFAANRNRIDSLLHGSKASSALLAIPHHETWEVLDSSAPETLFLMSGKSVLKYRTGNGEEDAITISPDAAVSVPLKSSFRVTNNHPEPLLLLAVKYH